jgi:hypothetical protein
VGTSRKVTAHRNVRAAVQNKKIKKRNKEYKNTRQRIKNIQIKMMTRNKIVKNAKKNPQKLKQMKKNYEM